MAHERRTGALTGETTRGLAAAAGIAGSAILALTLAMYLTLSAWDAPRQLAQAPALAGERAGDMAAGGPAEGAIRLTR